MSDSPTLVALPESPVAALAPADPAPKATLTLDWASYDAAKAAVLRWHYSRAMPTAKLVKVGAWEDGQFIGVVLFGRGATINIGKPYGLEQTEVCELVRVALGPHRCQTSQVVARAVKMLKQANPGIRLVVSYADSGQNHHGGIYQAMNWIYVGSAGYHSYRIRGKLMHPKSIHSTYGHESIDWLRKNVDPQAERVETAPKYKYLMPLDAKMRKQVEPLRKPYPKRDTSAEGADSGTAGFQPAGGGASPTPAHQLRSTAFVSDPDDHTPIVETPENTGSPQYSDPANPPEMGS